VLLFIALETKYDMIVSISLSLALVSLFVILPLLVNLNKRVFEVKMKEIVMITAIPVAVYVFLSML
jgi:uncharacterized membrane protein (DUF485 family)